MSTEKANTQNSNGWKATWRAVKRQADAMGVDVFEVGLFKPANPGDQKPEPEMFPRTWDKQTLLRSVGWLRYQNSQGRNIYIRPKGEHPLSMVDDLTAEAIHQMKQQGFEPCIVVETSPGNFQAWLNHGKILHKAESTLAARLLAQRFGGDQGAADWRHFGRLAGFTNRKPKYNFDSLHPFARLIEATGEPYNQRHSFLDGVAAEIEIAQNARVAATTNVHMTKARPRRSIEWFRANPVYANDNTRVDLAYAVHALAHGASETDVRAALHSRDLHHKGEEKRQSEYVERTVKKAYAAVESRSR